MKEKEFSIYGKVYTTQLPIMAPVPKDAEDVTDKFYDFLVNLSTWKMIDDILFGYWQKVLEEHNIVNIN